MKDRLPQMRGLTSEEVLSARALSGMNVIKGNDRNVYFKVALNVCKEPMFLLLVGAATLYFILGRPTEGSAMIVAMMIVAAISMYQEIRSSNAMSALRALASPKVTVLRDGSEILLNSEELVPGDIIILSEGEIAPADAEIIDANDLTINESAITGESIPVAKDEEGVDKKIFHGSIINSGRCLAVVTLTGMNTILGKMGNNLTEIQEVPTRMQKSIRRFVKQLAIFGFAAFLLIWFTNYMRDGLLLGGLISGLTLAMAVIPEEIPVAFSSFMALGAFYMARRGIITRTPQTMENLGRVDVLCVDKTGTITENIMAVRYVYDPSTDSVYDLSLGERPKFELLRIARLASEPSPFDAMEMAIVNAFAEMKSPDDVLPTMSFEYPLGGKPPMMTHVYELDGQFLAASKGAPEKIIEVCHLSIDQKTRIAEYVSQFTVTGFRVLGVASAIHVIDGKLPEKQEDFDWKFEGLFALYDPPRKNIPAILKQLNSAGIKIKMITGDHYQTAIAISRQTGLADNEQYLTGDQVMSMDEVMLQKECENIDVFGRMFPEAKLKVINALKKNYHVVAMIGDGINDGPALKAADVGIAMGRNGTEIARQASDLILTDDNLEKVAEAITQGKKISSNLKKAIRYIISIHIPIILIATLPVILGWKFPNIFTPVHIIFLELIMGPTCSVFFEREPYEPAAVLEAKGKAVLMNNKEMLFSVIQGLGIAAGVLALYYYYMNRRSIEETRTVVFMSMLFSNLLLTFVNRSFTENITKTIKYKNNLAGWIVLTTLVFIAVLIFVRPVSRLFGLAHITLRDYAVILVMCLIVAGATEVYKVIRRHFIHTVRR